VTPRTETLLAGQYFLAVEGLALMRQTLRYPESCLPRVDEIRDIAAKFDEFPNSLAIPMIEHDIEEGYTKWSQTYDSPNPAIEGEEPVVHAILAELPAGDALDAACGTGRHAAHLAAIGHRVIGVDGTDAMLDIAREKLPDVDLRRGRLEDLPLDDACVDLVTCGLALTHVPDLAPVMREFARVLRPGGTAVLSDIHPFNTIVGGGIAGFSGRDLRNGIPYVLNRTHLLSDYVRAFALAGLSVADCIEVPMGQAQIERLPSFGLYPDASREAYEGIPYLLIWRLQRS
jgi:ubiquinone/menaquinone biosynthesis C-methylase UbiE